MSGIIEKIKSNPHFPAIFAALSYTLLTLGSAISLYFYFTGTVSNDFWHWQLVIYIIMIANGVLGFSEFIDEDSFFPLRDLLDYCQVSLALPCYAAEMWIKTEIGPPEIAGFHATLGLIAVCTYILMECRRQDLTDLAVFANGISLLCMALLSINLFTLIATSIFLAGYCIYKRHDDVCCMAPMDKFNFVMAAFALTSLASFDDNVIQATQDTLSMSS
ncbi:hypothetical protein ABEB36_009665 [Hypothenemus hampei]|uniref:Transmembrane protein n=1 Tax=Hypothenemus hampei TaxID=57062 RepID=A0ABD1EH31_HYPHA